MTSWPDAVLCAATVASSCILWLRSLPATSSQRHQTVQLPPYFRHIGACLFGTSYRYQSDLSTLSTHLILFLNTSVCSLLMSTVLLPPSDRTRLGFKPCAWLLCALSSVCMYVCVCVCCIAFHLSSTSSVTGGKVHLQNDQLFCVSFFLSSWWRGTRRCLAGELSLSCARPAADGWPLMWVNRPLQVSQLGQLSLSSFPGR